MTTCGAQEIRLGSSIIDTLVAKKKNKMHPYFYAGTISPIDNPLVFASDVIDRCALAFGVSKEDIKGRSRERSVVYARHVASYILRKYTKLSYREIGDITGGRDHASVLNSFNVAQDLIETDARFSETVNGIIGYDGRIQYYDESTSKDQNKELIKAVWDYTVEYIERENVGVDRTSKDRFTLSMKALAISFLKSQGIYYTHMADITGYKDPSSIPAKHNDKIRLFQWEADRLKDELKQIKVEIENQSINSKR